MWRRVLLSGAIAATVTGCAHYVSPPGPAIPDRPGYTDGPAAIPAGALQLEAGYTDDRATGVTYKTLGEALLRIGIGGQTELRLFANSYATRAITDASVSGMEDSKIGMKTTLWTKPDSIHSVAPNVAFLAAATLPSGARDFRNSHVQPEAKIAANWTTPTPFSIYSNLGAARVYDGFNWSTRGWLSLALWYSANPRVSLFSEGISARSLQNGALPSNYLDAGATYLINDRFQLDLRVGHGIRNGVSRERFIGGGFAKRW